MQVTFGGVVVHGPFNFRVPETLTFETGLSAKLFFCIRIKYHFHITSHLASVWTGFFFNQPWSQANSSCRQGEVLENSFYEPLILWMCFHFLLTSLSKGPSKVVVWTQWVTLLAPFWKRKQLEIVGKIFWKPSGYIFLDVTASFFKSVHALEGNTFLRWSVEFL